MLSFYMLFQAELFSICSINTYVANSNVFFIQLRVICLSETSETRHDTRDLTLLII